MAFDLRDPYMMFTIGFPGLEQLRDRFVHRYSRFPQRIILPTEEFCKATNQVCAEGWKTVVMWDGIEVCWSGNQQKAYRVGPIPKGQDNGKV